jgi:hypothetical protein
MENLRYIIAATAEGFGLQILERFANPLTACNSHALIAL